MSLMFDSYNDNLLDKFDNIDDLPVSEEMLGAYLEGNLDPADQYYVENTIEANPELSFISEIDSEEPSLFDFYNDDNFIVGDETSQLDLDEVSVPADDYGFLEDFQLPDIDQYETEMQHDGISDDPFIPEDDIFNDPASTDDPGFTEDTFNPDSDPLPGDLLDYGTDMNPGSGDIDL